MAKIIYEWELFYLATDTHRMTQTEMLRGLEVVVPESLKAGNPGSFKTQVFFTINDCYRGKII